MEVFLEKFVKSETGRWEGSRVVRGCTKGGDFSRRKIRKVDRIETIGVRERVAEKLNVYWSRYLIHQKQNRIKLYRNHTGIQK